MISKTKVPGINSYYGGKSGAGTYQTIINQFPPHRAYIEGFLGGGAIMRYKKPATVSNTGFDKDASVIKKFTNAYGTKSNYEFIADDVMAYLQTIIDNPGLFILMTKVLIYLDPPYIIESRSTQKKVYKHEMTVDDHKQLIKIIKQLPCMVAISHYPHSLYETELANWRKIEYQSTTRKGKATEHLFMNYPEPTELHDYRFLGTDYRQRERIRLKVKRHLNKLAKLPVLEQRAILESLNQMKA